MTGPDEGGRSCASTLCALGLGAALAFVLVNFGFGAAAASNDVVSQKDRAFHPSSLVVSRGQVVHFENDDGDLTHHVYIKSPDFNFDSGEQDPGDTVNIRFSVRGHFTVLCRIHPKMHLDVDVQ